MKQQGEHHTVKTIVVKDAVRLQTVTNVLKAVLDFALDMVEEEGVSLKDVPKVQGIKSFVHHMEEDVAAISKIAQSLLLEEGTHAQHMAAGEDANMKNVQKALNRIRLFVFVMVEGESARCLIVTR